MKRILIIGTVGFGLAATLFSDKNETVHQADTVNIPYEDYHLSTIYDRLNVIDFQIREIETSPIQKDLVSLYNFDVIDRFDYLPP